jgi:hypothetical protein
LRLLLHCARRRDLDLKLVDVLKPSKLRDPREDLAEVILRSNLRHLAYLLQE